MIFKKEDYGIINFGDSMIFYGKIALFDFDGTLVDSMPVWGEKMFRLLRMQGITPPEGLLRTITPLGDAGTLNYYQNNFALTMTKEEMIQEMDNYALPKYANEIPLKENVLNYLQALKENGVKLYILTASPHKAFEPCLQRLGILDMFEKCWCCDDFNMVKSDVNIYLEVAKTIGVNPEDITFFDDNKVAIETANKAGLHTIAVYDDSSSNDKEDMKKVADYYSNEYADLI